MSDPHAVALAIDALRRGWPVAIGGLSLLAVETADHERLKTFDPEGAAPLLISAGRAVTLKLANQLEAAVPDAPVLIERVAWLDFDTATALADPQLDLATRQLVHEGATVDLSAREFHLMHALLERPGAIVSRAQLEERIYGWGEEVSSNAVEVLIHGVRRKAGAEVIRNVRGLGWRVVAGGQS